MHKAKRAGVIGWPVSHSLSPALHGYWLKHYNINGSYDAHEVSPGHLQTFLRSLGSNEFSGINLTLPHKEQALHWVDEVDAQAQRIGAINTIVMRGGKSVGYNTDAYGFVQNLIANGVSPSGKRCLVIGAGGAARAVCAGLLDAGCSVVITNRTRQKADQLALDMDKKIAVADWSDCAYAMRDVGLLVNATSLGMKGNVSLDITLDTLPAHAVVTDVVYTPLMTPLLSSAQANGHTIVDGLGMLLYQAQYGFKAWFGVKPEVTQELRDHVLKALP